MITTQLSKTTKDRVLIVAYNDLGIGGIQAVIMNIVRTLSDEFTFDIICFDTNRSDFNDEFRSYGGRIFEIDQQVLKNRFLAKIDFYIRGHRIKAFTKRIIRDNGPYIAVHSNKEIENGLVLKAAEDMGIRVRIAHAHTAFEKKYNPIAKVYSKYLTTLVNRTATNLVACSEKAGRIAFGSEAEYRVIYNMIDKSFFETHYEYTEHNAPLLLQVGMICENKNQIFSISVLNELKKQYPEAKLVIIGSSKDSNMEQYLGSINSYIKEHGLDGSVTILSAGSDVRTELMKSDYLIHPSYFEGFGIVMLEAQALGIKCFASTGVSDEVDCGGCTFIDLNEGAEAWSKRIINQFEIDHGMRSKYDMTRFRPEVIMDQYRKLYRGEL